ncbi:MAG TPA: sorbosone dehydrogenase family protein [Luteimonas sp.]|nr:sorbosone dehydrogenase family protein [Luteimonas sp.]
MNARRFRAGCLLAATMALAGCGEHALLPFNAGTGPAPVLPPPKRTLIPTVEIAKATGWPAGEAPTAAAGLQVAAFATGLDHPRWLCVLPDGSVLVAETNAPARPKDDDSLKAKIMDKAMAYAGAATPSADRITLLRDADGDGAAETRSVFLAGLVSPFGMALVPDKGGRSGTLYIADSDALLRVPWRAGQVQAGAAPERVANLPAGAINHHWTKNVIASADGRRLYVTVGSNSNVGENGIEAEAGRALILEVDPATGASSVFASGLRNPNGMGWRGGTLWTVVNERDELGSDLVPDYLTSVARGAFYGWPYSYYGQHVDARVRPQRPDLVASAIPPDYALGTHVAPLGLAFANKASAAALPPAFADGAFVGEHGSWNRKPPSGYKVVFVPFSGEQPSGPQVDVLAGFLGDDGEARGRPVGVAIDAHGALLVADDVGDTVWRVTAARPPAP